MNFLYVPPGLPKGSKTTNWVRETGGIDGEAYGLEADAFAPATIQAAFVVEAAPYLRAFRALDGTYRKFKRPFPPPAAPGVPPCRWRRRP